jgi:superfamily II DNA/RNA helicase
VLGRRDILGAAETGSGKTLAFGIPILHRILEDKAQSTGRYDLQLYGAAFIWWLKVKHSSGWLKLLHNFH